MHLVSFAKSLRREKSMFVPCLASRCKSLRLTTVRSLAAKYENMRLPDFLVPRDRGTSSQNELSADAWSGNLANRRSFKYSLAVSGKRSKKAKWNGHDIEKIERLGGRNWLRNIESGFAELVQHEDMIFVIMWDGELGKKLPTHSPSRLGILYRKTQNDE